MKRLIAAFLSILLGFVLQTTIFQWLSFGGIVPNILIVVTASYGFMTGEKPGLLVGFFAGLLTDIFFGTFLGFNALLYMYIGYLNGRFHKLFYEEDIKLPMILVLSSDLLYSLGYYVMMFLLRGRFDFRYYFMHIILPEAVYTIVISLLFYPLLLWVHNRITNNVSRGSDFDFV